MKTDTNLYIKLIKDILAFCFGSVGSKILSFLLVPLYTYYLSAEEYGSIDYITVTIQLITPIITLSVSNAVLRFTVDDCRDKQEILKYSLGIVIKGILIFALCIPLLCRTKFFDGYEFYFVAILIFQILDEILGQYTKGCGWTLIFSILGIIHTGILFGFNIVFIVWLNMGIQGYLLAVLISYLIPFVAYSILNIHDLIVLNKVKVSDKTKKDILSFSIPLIPNNLMWWIMNAIDRYFIIWGIGVAENGIYAVANKLPTILNTLFTIFNQAWQISVIQNSNNKDEKKYFDNIWELFSFAMVESTFFLLILTRPISKILYSAEYFCAWQYTPFLILSMFCSIYASYFGTFYIAHNQTKKIMFTSVAGALTNIVMNFILIPIWNVHGAAIATFLSYFCVMVMRLFQQKNIIEMSVDKGVVIGDVIMLTITATLVLVKIQTPVFYIFIFVILFIFHRRGVYLLCKQLKRNKRKY